VQWDATASAKAAAAAAEAVLLLSERAAVAGAGAEVLLPLPPPLLLVWPALLQNRLANPLCSSTGSPAATTCSTASCRLEGAGRAGALTEAAPLGRDTCVSMNSAKTWEF